MSKESHCVCFQSNGLIDLNLNISVQAMTGVYLLTFVGGHDLWKFKFPVIDMYCSEVIEIVMYGE